MLNDIEERSVDCQVILAYRFRTLVGWGIFSKETTNFHFSRSPGGFKSEEGRMFQVFVDPSYRNQGIASEIYKRAQQLAGEETICVCPWDDRSTGFYNKFPNVKTKWL
jgi:GNAT superfamily N-acetyltransferase